jgi:hypothetical protein
MPKLKLKRYKDGCYAVVVRKKRGPVGHDKPTAIVRYKLSGLIKSSRTD